MNSRQPNRHHQIVECEPVLEQPARLRLLFAVPYSPRFDAKHGGRVIAQRISRLAERHDVGVVHLAVPHDSSIDPVLAARCSFVERVELRRGRWPHAEWRHRLRVLTLPLTQRPTQVAAVYSSCFSDAVHAAALRWRPDVIQLEGDTIAYCGRRLEGLPGVRVLDCDDPGLEASKDLVARTRGRQRLAHRLDVVSWQRYWLRTLPKLDSIVALTDTDQQAFRRVIADTPVVRIPLGIDLPERPLSPSGSGEPSVIFVGCYNHHPNADAALRLTRSIMPIARRRLPRLRLVLVGDGVTDELRAAVGSQDVIEVSVPDVAPYVDEAALMALPIRIGGGMRVKLLEALAAGKAVVASARAASGLNVTDGRELLLAETDQEFAEQIVRLASDAEARSQLANNARQWAVCNLAWESRVDEYERLYRSLLTDVRRVRVTR